MWSPRSGELTIPARAIKHYSFRSRDRRYANPAAAVERRREPAPQIRLLALEQVTEQLAVVKDRPVTHALVAALIYTGLAVVRCPEWMKIFFVRALDVGTMRWRTFSAVIEQRLSGNPG